MGHKKEKFDDNSIELVGSPIEDPSKAVALNAETQVDIKNDVKPSSLDEHMKAAT